MVRLLDTNIISNVVTPKPSESLLAWMAQQRDENLFISALTVAEIRRGILEKTARQEAGCARRLVLRLGRAAGVVCRIRILAFDDRAALIWARLMAEGKAAGRPRGGLDMIVAAVAGANGCVVVTDNERNFAGLEILNLLRRPEA